MHGHEQEYRFPPYILPQASFHQCIVAARRLPHGRRRRAPRATTRAVSEQVGYRPRWVDSCSPNGVLLLTSSRGSLTGLTLP